ncbi:MAG TPA: CPBP family intramembrane glutamic endopeptidase [Steroidobacteraceae bacterium]|jgi:membrane protease YdiL (CAAX protease family)
MKQWLARLPLSVEVLIVLLFAFGPTVPGSLAALFDPESLARRAAPPITNSALLRTSIHEVLVFVMLAAFLWVRGWRPQRLGLKPTLKDSAMGAALAVANYVAYVTLWLIVVNLWPRIGQIGASMHLVGPGLRLTNIVLISIVNPLFEEVFVCGYVVTALQPRLGMATAVNISAGIRVFYHLYQGAIGVIGIVPMGLIFGYWFGRTGRLWPLIVAHAVGDVAGLIPYVASS